MKETSVYATASQHAFSQAFDAAVKAGYGPNSVVTAALAALDQVGAVRNGAFEAAVKAGYGPNSVVTAALAALDQVGAVRNGAFEATVKAGYGPNSVVTAASEPVSENFSVATSEPDVPSLHGRLRAGWDHLTLEQRCAVYVWVVVSIVVHAANIVSTAGGRFDPYQLIDDQIKAISFSLAVVMFLGRRGA